MEGRWQQTLARGFECAGVGLHSGEPTRVRVIPAPAGEGRYFVRVDLPGGTPIPARWEAVSQTQLSTELANSSQGSVRTVEHLLAALSACGIDCARIEIDGGEVPLLDGSSRPWVEEIIQAGIRPLQVPVPPPLTVDAPVWVQEQDAWIVAIPAPSLRLTYGIDFPTAAIAEQWYTWHPTTDSFTTQIAPARTFGLSWQVAAARAAGGLRGGSLENAIVCDEQDWLNPPLRFANEPVRHKLLDLVGDLSLLGVPLQAHVLAYKASHRLHVRLVQALQEAALNPVRDR